MHFKIPQQNKRITWYNSYKKLPVFQKIPQNVMCFPVIPVHQLRIWNNKNCRPAWNGRQLLTHWASLAAVPPATRRKYHYLTLHHLNPLLLYIFFILYYKHCRVYTVLVQCTLYIHCIVYTVYFIVYIVHCTVYIPHNTCFTRALYNVYCIMYIV